MVIFAYAERTEICLCEHADRLDAPGVLHHVMARGIERRKLFIIDKRSGTDKGIGPGFDFVCVGEEDEDEKYGCGAGVRFCSERIESSGVAGWGVGREESGVVMQNRRRGIIF